MAADENDALQIEKDIASPSRASALTTVCRAGVENLLFRVKAVLVLGPRLKIESSSSPAVCWKRSSPCLQGVSLQYGVHPSLQTSQVFKDLYLRNGSRSGVQGSTYDTTTTTTTTPIQIRPMKIDSTKFEACIRFYAQMRVGGGVTDGVPLMNQAHFRVEFPNAPSKNTSVVPTGLFMCRGTDKAEYIVVQGEITVQHLLPYHLCRGRVQVVTNSGESQFAPFFNVSVKSHKWHLLAPSAADPTNPLPPPPSYYSFGDYTESGEDGSKNEENGGAFSVIDASVKLLDDRRWRFPYPLDGSTQTRPYSTPPSTDSTTTTTTQEDGDAMVVVVPWGDITPPCYAPASVSNVALVTPYHYSMYGETDDLAFKETQLRAECVLSTLPTSIENEEFSDRGFIASSSSLMRVLEGSETASALLCSTDTIDVTRSLVRQIIAPAMAGHAVPSLFNRLYAGFRANLEQQPQQCGIDNHSQKSAYSFNIMHDGGSINNASSINTATTTSPQPFKFGAMQSQIDIEEALVVGRPTDKDGLFLRQFLHKLNQLRMLHEPPTTNTTSLHHGSSMAPVSYMPTALADIGGATPISRIPGTSTPPPPSSTILSGDVSEEVHHCHEAMMPIRTSASHLSSSTTHASHVNAPAAPSHTAHSSSVSVTSSARSKPSPQASQLLKPTRPQSARNVQLSQRNMTRPNLGSSLRTTRPSLQLQHPVSPRTRDHLALSTPLVKTNPHLVGSGGNTSTSNTYELDRKSRGPSLGSVMSSAARQEDQRQNKARLRKQLLAEDDEAGEESQ
eukprot:TRINITY_DN10668_c0_g1_i1.p1 TRINITY_DN10668_c0_g1~~TRINITY_DN10668_c0_g1_i1.p1  ORF type:complete len:787 (+),score=74.95 TRINITY_DN10668_c0_g1_i1:2-2362(+)